MLLCPDFAIYVEAGEETSPTGSEHLQERS
jgi:hypothetical protein